jgi:L-lactate utilization protein LutC
MAKKQRMQTGRRTEAPAPWDSKAKQSLQDMLNNDALAKLKQFQHDVKVAKEREEREAAERRRRELEEKERNKSFAELLDEYEKKGGGKYS